MWVVTVMVLLLMVVALVLLLLLDAGLSGVYHCMKMKMDDARVMRFKRVLCTVSKTNCEMLFDMRGMATRGRGRDIWGRLEGCVRCSRGP
jgi:hypothetical protein